MASKWAGEQEWVILRDGVPLTAPQMKDASAAGVAQPGAVRLLRVASIPSPEHPALRAAAAMTQLLTPNTAGLTLRHGIFIRADRWDNRRLVVHELVHTSQYERVGRFLPFLRQYLGECLSIGDPEAPMEQEAVTTAARICG